jgi:hypothetical protein
MGTKLVRRKGLVQSGEGRAESGEHPISFSALRFPLSALLLALLFHACRSEIKKATPPPAVPQVRATVITIETKVQPDNKTFTHSIVIAGDKARSLDELDHWRLFDLKANTITFVDDIARSYRIAPFAPGKRMEEIAATRQTEPLQGVIATLWTARAGGYARQLWIGNHPAIPPQLFSMMTGIKLQGFPLAEHAELPYSNKKLVVDKTVTRIESKDVPASLFEIGRAYTRH